MYSCVALIIGCPTVKMSMIIAANKGWQVLIEYVIGLLKVLMRLNCIQAFLMAMGCVARTGLPAGTSVTSIFLQIISGSTTVNVV